MAAVLPRPAPVNQRNPSPAPPLSLNTSSRGTPTAIPNKHIPTCSPGPRPHSRQFDSPISSPASPRSTHIEVSSLLYPPTGYKRVATRTPVYEISGQQLQDAIDHCASQPLPDPKQIFPWLHGLHPENNLQLAFFLSRRRALRKIPRCLRSIAIVKTRGNLSHSKLKGAVAPEEILATGKTSDDAPLFLEVDPRDGFSVRNFQIQAAKLATLSDIIVYGDDQTPREETQRLAEQIARAQKTWREKYAEEGVDSHVCNTFILTDPFNKVQRERSQIIAIDNQGLLSGNVLDFFNAERQEMQTMSAAGEIATNVWLGPTPDSTITMQDSKATNNIEETVLKYDLLIEATDMAQMPDRKAFRVLENLLSSSQLPKTAVPQLEFPGSGSIMPPTWSQSEVDALMRTCAWMYKQANGLASDSQAMAGADSIRGRKDSKVTCSPVEKDIDGDSIMASAGDSDGISEGSNSSATGRKILLHCADGYTETTLLAVAYYMYAKCVPLHTAYIELHTRMNRNFFAYPTDIALLTAIQPRILQSSPAWSSSFSELSPPTPSWMSKIDGSMPSRITDYMYLGNLGHANNPELLKELGIGRVLSVGEPVTWTERERQTFADMTGHGGDVSDHLMFIDKVQDNGVDPLTEDFPKCLEFIEKGRKAGIATLVHCRVGVSRSATICIAEIMNEYGLSFPKAYCFVRARRLNVIIQPHLRFSYELLKWEEHQAQKRGKPFKRDLEWATIAREIAAMNRPYSRQ